MSKDAYYFSHDSNASRDPKIMQMRSIYKAEGYGWYWMLVEQMREQDNYKLPLSGKYAVNAYALQMDANAERLQCFINDCVKEFHLFEQDAEFLWSNSLLRRMEMKDIKSEKARQSALERWGKSNVKDANAMRTHTDSNASAMQRKERKVKEKKVKTTPLNGLFETFWKAYPKKVAKQDAFKAFVKINPDETLLAVMLEKVEAFKVSDDWVKEGGQYIPYPATWLNKRRWEDELKDTPQPIAKPTESIREATERELHG